MVLFGLECIQPSSGISHVHGTTSDPTTHRAALCRSPLIPVLEMVSYELNAHARGMHMQRRASIHHLD